MTAWTDPSDQDRVRQARQAVAASIQATAQLREKLTADGAVQLLTRLQRQLITILGPAPRDGPRHRKAR